MHTARTALQSFKETMARWASGVTIVTVRSGGTIHGMTASSFTSVSGDPPLVLVCILKSSRTHDYLQHTTRFAVNVLSEEQRALAEHFAGRRTSDDVRTQSLTWQTGACGCALVPDALAHVECAVEATYEAGTHAIVVARVEATSVDHTRRPLLYWDREFRQLASPDALPPLSAGQAHARRTVSP